MKVSELITVLQSVSQDADIVIMEEDDYINVKEGIPVYSVEDAIVGLYDEQTQDFTDIREIENNEKDVFGDEAVALIISER